ncbi:MAG: PAS domain S-box protein, partial [Anaerolineales bacterium]
RLARFFHQDRDNNTYRITKSIRDMVVFATQNIINDPPFSKLDLISCRNLLIYMDTILQKKVLALFHYALNPDGYLFLGNSESLGEFSELFKVVDRTWRIFQSMGMPTNWPVTKNITPSPIRRIAGSALQPDENKLAKETSVHAIVDRILLDQHTPPCAIINEQAEVIYIHGHTGRYLEPSAGDASLNIIRMARDGLKQALTTAIRKVIVQKTAVPCGNLHVKTDGDIAIVDLLVTPIQEQGLNHALYMVIFNEVAALLNEASTPEESSQRSGQDRRNAELERELRSQQEYMQTIIEELETANEELMSTNEELQSANEELQSTNEELETSKEELQSVNEELTTVNTELQEKLIDLSQANNDINNLLAGTGVGTVFVDNHLIIQRFTPAATDVINLIKTDTGRPLSHIASKLNYRSLVDDVQMVLTSLVPRKMEVQTMDGHWYLVNILPYRTLENVIDGAVLTFSEISEMKRLQDLSRLAIVIRDSNDAITMQDLKGNIRAWNPGAQRIYGWSEEEALQMNIKDIVPENKRENALDLIRRLVKGEEITSFVTQRLTKDQRVLDVWLNISKLVNEDGQTYAIATTEREEMQNAEHH